MSMSGFARYDQSVLARWWWTVDRWTLAAFGALMVIGVVLIAAGGPAVAVRTGLPANHFLIRHLALLGPSIIVMIGLSMLPLRGVRMASLTVLGIFLPLLALTLVMGSEAKGASRWIYIAGLSVQPSEFVKPAFAVMLAFLLTRVKRRAEPISLLIAFGLWMLIVALLMLQPDLGQTVLTSAICFGELFLAGLPLILVFGFAVMGCVGLFGAYIILPHVASRIDRFLHPEVGDTYQIDRSLQAFANGGLTGTGPGQGVIKHMLPDAHADFIFAVAGEELGLIVCLIIVALFAFVILRGLLRVLGDSNLFVLLASAGLVLQFGLQALINMGSALHLMPTKGMTLPYLSYGGSSLLALGVTTGLLLALTRRRNELGDDL
jgi:cell division protein FtsW